MAKEGFKAGDQVVSIYGKRVWSVVRAEGQQVIVKCNVNGVRTIFNRTELKLLYRKGKRGQLLFDFMYHQK